MHFSGIDVFDRARSFFIHACLVALGVIGIGSPLLRAQTTIAYVQGTASVPQTAQSTVTATNANDLLVGANLVATRTTGPGTSFTSRMITSPNGDILEDRIVTATGHYSATAPLSSNGQWIMQMVAFRAAGASPPPPDVT